MMLFSARALACLFLASVLFISAAGKADVFVLAIEGTV